MGLAEALRRRYPYDPAEDESGLPGFDAGREGFYLPPAGGTEEPSDALGAGTGASTRFDGAFSAPFSQPNDAPTSRVDEVKQLIAAMQDRPEPKGFTPKDLLMLGGTVAALSGTHPSAAFGPYLGAVAGDEQRKKEDRAQKLQELGLLSAAANADAAQSYRAQQASVANRRAQWTALRPTMQGVSKLLSDPGFLSATPEQRSTMLEPFKETYGDVMGLAPDEVEKEFSPYYSLQPSAYQQLKAHLATTFKLDQEDRRLAEDVGKGTITQGTADRLRSYGLPQTDFVTGGSPDTVAAPASPAQGAQGAASGPRTYEDVLEDVTKRNPGVGPAKLEQMAKAEYSALQGDVRATNKATELDLRKRHFDYLERALKHRIQNDKFNQEMRGKEFNETVAQNHASNQIRRAQLTLDQQQFNAQMTGLNWNQRIERAHAYEEDAADFEKQARELERPRWIGNALTGEMHQPTDTDKEQAAALRKQAKVSRAAGAQLRGVSANLDVDVSDADKQFIRSMGGPSLPGGNLGDYDSRPSQPSPKRGKKTPKGNTIVGSKPRLR